MGTGRREELGDAAGQLVTGNPPEATIGMTEEMHRRLHAELAPGGPVLALPDQPQVLRRRQAGVQDPSRVPAGGQDRRDLDPGIGMQPDGSPHTVRVVVGVSEDGG
jgi:hypothetical protein